MAKIERLFFTLDEAEEVTGISRWTWRSKAYAGEVESNKFGRRLMIPIEEVHRLIAEGRRPRRDGLPAGAPSSKDRKTAVRA